MKKCIVTIFFMMTILGAASRIVYITPSGKKYHSTRNCRSLSRSHKIIEINIDKVRNRQPCKICF